MKWVILKRTKRIGSSWVGTRRPIELSDKEADDLVKSGQARYSDKQTEVPRFHASVVVAEKPLTIDVSRENEKHEEQEEQYQPKKRGRKPKHHYED